MTCGVSVFSVVSAGSSSASSRPPSYTSLTNTNHQPTTTHHPPPTNHHQPPTTTNHQPPTNHHQPPTANGALHPCRMYAMAFYGVGLSARGFWVAGAGLGALVLCKGSDVRPGVLSSPPLCRWFGGLGALPGVGCTPWRSLVSAALPGTWCCARGRMYALGSWLRLIQSGLGLRKTSDSKQSLLGLRSRLPSITVASPVMALMMRIFFLRCLSRLLNLKRFNEPLRLKPRADQGGKRESS